MYGDIVAKMTKKQNIKDDDKTGLIIGGGTMLGLGTGFFLLSINPLFFVGSIMAGIGVGLIVAYVLKK